MTTVGINQTDIFLNGNSSVALGIENVTIGADWPITNGTLDNVTYTQEQTTLGTLVTNITQQIQDLNETTTTGDGRFVYNHTLAPFVPDGGDFYHHLSGKDETLFLTLVLMAVFIPILLIAIFTVVCIRKRREKKARRSERLLRNAQDLAMDDYPPAMYRIQALRA